MQNVNANRKQIPQHLCTNIPKKFSKEDSHNEHSDSKLIPVIIVYIIFTSRVIWFCIINNTVYFINKHSTLKPQFPTIAESFIKYRQQPDSNQQ